MFYEFVSTERMSVYRSQLKEGRMMKKALLTAALAILFLSGCASVPMESLEQSDAAKEFSAPASDRAGLYVYRSGSFGGALKKDIWIDGECIGESAPNVFFYKEVQGDKEHTISTESEFSPNDLPVATVGGKNYFIQQYMKMGVFVGGAGLKLVDEEVGKKAIKKLKMAKTGSCS